MEPAIILTLALAFVPQQTLATDRCGTIELNHVMTVREHPWNGIEIDVCSYWLGRRRLAECGDVWIVDWWREYHDEQVVRMERRVSVILFDNRYRRSVLVVADAYRETWTFHDVEWEQRKMLTEKYGADHHLYRRGLAGAKPQ